MEFNTSTPTVSGMYLVDRGMQGKAYRYYNAETMDWGMCGYDMQEAKVNRDNKSAVGFYPWIGPLTGPNYNLDAPEVVVETETNAKPKQSPKAPKRKMARMATAVVTPKSVTTNTKKTRVSTKAAAVYPDGTIFYREDRQKWVAMMNGKQEAARPTIEACIKFLKKKYNVDGKVIPKE